MARTPRGNWVSSTHSTTDGSTIVRVQFGYTTTTLRVALQDKLSFDDLLIRVMAATRDRLSHHELFTLLVLDGAERVEALASRWRHQAVPVAAERAALAAAASFAAADSPVR